MEEKLTFKKKFENWQLKKLEKEQGKKKIKGYYVYLFMVLALVYIIDEVTSNMHDQLVSSIIPTFFSDFALGDSRFALMVGLSNLLMALSCFYKPLADKFGRKPFLFINTFGMGVALFFCFLSYHTGSFLGYAFGFCLIRFFVTPDEQVVYIFETTKANKRATTYSIIKAIALLSIVLIPVLRRSIMQNIDDRWRLVFLVPMALAFIISFIALFISRETDVFIEERIAYLRLTDEERLEIKKKDKENSKKQGGFFNSIIFTFKNKQVLFICIAIILFTFSRFITGEYTQLITYGYIGDFTTEDITKFVTSALFVSPFFEAIITLVYGLFSDKFGRKKVVVGLMGIALASFIMFIVSINNRFNAYVTGIFIGLMLGAYNSVADTYIMMASESSPTNLRASVLTLQSMFYGAGMALSQLGGGIVISAFTKACTNGDVVDYATLKTKIILYCLILFSICLVSSMLTTLFCVKETKDLNLD